MKRIYLFLTVLAVMTAFSAIASAGNIPEDVQKYAEEKAFPHFLEMAGVLNLPESVNLSDLQLGDGYAVNQLQSIPDAKSFEDLTGEADRWIYLVNAPNGENVSFLQVNRSSAGLTNSGGGDSAFFGKAMNKMQELIRKFGKDDDPLILQYNGSSFLFAYQFGNDWRVMDVKNLFMDERFLSVQDYRQLPTGEETLKALQAEYEKWQKILAENDSAAGGFDLTFPFHEYAADSTPRKSALPLTAVIAGAIAAPLAVVGGVLMAEKTKKKKK